jgi:hypothetical protein
MSKRGYDRFGKIKAGAAAKNVTSTSLGLKMI